MWSKIGGYWTLAYSAKIFFTEHELIDILVIQTFLTRIYRFLNKEELSKNSTECFEFPSEKKFDAYKLFQRVSCYNRAIEDRVESKQKCYKKNSRLFLEKKVIMRTQGKKFPYCVTWVVSVSWEQLYAPHFCFPFIGSFLI